jgi:hypothetical protein
VAFTFQGTYTQNRGDQAAVGTVQVVQADGTTSTATLDEGGSYSLVVNAEEGLVTVVETFDGVLTRVYSVGVSRGSTTDTSRDIGYLGPVAQSGASVLPAVELEMNDAVAALTNGQGATLFWDTYYDMGGDELAALPEGIGLTYAAGQFTATEAGRWIVEVGTTALADATALVTLQASLPSGPNSGPMLGWDTQQAGRKISMSRVVDLAEGASFEIIVSVATITTSPYVPLDYVVGKITRVA